MVGRRSFSWAESAKHFEDIPVLSEFAKPFPNFLGEKKTAIVESFKRIAESLAKSKRTGVMQFTISDSRKTRQWCVAISPSGCEATETATERPDLEIITDVKSWTDIAAGRVALLEAYGLSKLRVRGDIEIARLLARRVQR